MDKNKCFFDGGRCFQLRNGVCLCSANDVVLPHGYGWNCEAENGREYRRQY